MCIWVIFRYVYWIHYYLLVNVGTTKIGATTKIGIRDKGGFQGFQGNLPLGGSLCGPFGGPPLGIPSGDLLF